MAKDPDGLTAWETQFAAWQQANQQANWARAHLMQVFADFVNGKGSWPTSEQLQLVERLYQDADRLSLELDQLVRNRLG